MNMDMIHKQRGATPLPSRGGARGGVCNFPFFIALTAMLLALGACTDENTFPGGNSYVPALESRYLHLGTTSLNMDAAASNKQLQVEAVTTAWQFRDFDTSWLTLSPSSGNSDESVNVAAAENRSAADIRTSVFTFESTQSDFSYQRQVSVTQQKATPYITATPSTFSFTAAGGTQSVTISTNADWTAANIPSWITMESSGSATTGKQLNITVGENLNKEENNATVTFTTTSSPSATATVKIVQAPAADPSVVPEVTETLTFPNTGGKYELRITSEVSWTATSQQSWLEVKPAEGKAGTSTLTIEALPNGSTDDREGNVYISIGNTRRITIPIRQRGIYIDVKPMELTFTPDAQTQQLTVESNTSWSVISKPDWLTASLSDGASVGTITGNATLELSVADYWGEAARTGTLILGQEGTSIQAKVSISQQSRYFSVTPTTAVSHPSKGGTHEVTVKGNDPWTATSTSSWMQLSQRSGNGDISVTLTTPDNPSIHSREDETTFKPSHLSPVTIRTMQAARYLQVDHTELTFFRRAATSEAVTISTDATYAVTSSDTSWLTVKQTGNTFTATVTENTTGKDREAKIVIAMTGLVAGETYNVELPVTQYYYSPGITIATFDADEQWDIVKTATAVITITGFGSDEKWD